MSDEYAEGALDLVELARLIVEVEQGSGGDIDSVRARVESSGLSFRMSAPRRRNTK